MKRFLFLVLTVVVACSLFVVPAFAKEIIVIDNSLDDLFIPVSQLPYGSYYIECYDGSRDNALVFRSEPFAYLANGESQYHYIGDFNGDVFLAIYPDNLGMYDVEGSFFTLEVEDGNWFGDYYFYNLVFFVDDSAPEEVPFLESIGLFFSIAISWLANVASFIVSRPVLLVALAMPIIGFAVGLFARFKNL